MRKQIISAFGIALVLAFVVETNAGCGNGKQCPSGCPATYVHVFLEVTSSPDGGAIGNVDVTFSGPSAGTMSCERADTETVCRWPSGPVTPGTYLLDIVAPGYQEAKVYSDLIVTSDPVCGCTGATLKPSQVTLNSI
jgi:hypothetical protein